MQKPQNINFASGPCSKHKGWLPPICSLAGRSHRSTDGLSLIQNIITLQKKILKIPNNYYVGIVSASSTGAMETLLWSLLGAKGIDAISHCIFSELWAYDIVNELKIKDVRLFKAQFPAMANIQDVNFDRDVVFCWSSTTSGTSFKDATWIPHNRTGLTICDAASAAFIFDFDWSKLDATAFSWQKGLGGEAGFGTIVLSPRAIERLENHQPSWPIPRVFRLASNKKVNFEIFTGHTINTPSMICIEDFYNILQWADKSGGIEALKQKVDANYSVVKQWITQQKTYKFLIDNEKQRAPHISCLDIASNTYTSLSQEEKWQFLKKIAAVCEQEKVGLDLLGHALTKPHIRIWTGPTIETEDIARLLPWLEYAYHKALTDN